MCLKRILFLLLLLLLFSLLLFVVFFFYSTSPPQHTAPELHCKVNASTDTIFNKNLCNYVTRKRDSRMSTSRSVDIRLNSISDDLYSKNFAEKADARDPLRFFRNRFLFPKVPSTSTTMRFGERCVYLCGNSLGLQPVSTKRYIDDFLEKWSNEGVEGHFTQPRQWVDIDETVNGSMAKIVGAKTNEVVVMNSLTANLHFLLVSFYRPTKQRFKIVIESKAFPSDIYAVKSQLRFHGFDESALVQLEPRKGESTLRVEDFERYLDQNGSDVALVLVSGIQYYTGQCFELDRIVRAGHRNGCVVGADLAHAVGNVELKLHDWNVDFAVWCTYKYMNSGPGNIGGAFVCSVWCSSSSCRSMA